VCKIEFIRRGSTAGVRLGCFESAAVDERVQLEEK
jgi:hypothetical protein